MLISMSCPADLTIAKNGKSNYVIVRPENSSLSQIYASKELQKFVKQMTGAELQIQTDSSPLPAKAILLGNGRYTSKILGQNVSVKKLGTDGFRICTSSPYLLVIGSKQRGTLYGVYELLEKYGGCRWYSSKFSVIPEISTWTIPKIDNTQVPAIQSRDLYYYDPMNNQDYSARIRNNGHGSRLDQRHGSSLYYAKRWMCHTFYHYLPPEKYFSEHPEYFSEWHGKRRQQQGSLCLSNPDVVNLVAARAKEILQEDPDATFVDLSTSDGGTPCTCIKCRTFNKQEKTNAGTMIRFVNQVAERLAKDFPNIYIETLAYKPTSTHIPPQSVKPHGNVIPRMCCSKCDFSKPLTQSSYPENIAYVKNLEGWSRISDKLLIWDYVTNFRYYLGPHPNFNSLQANIKLFRDHNVYGILEQGNYNSPHGEFAELRTWILAKLMWNPDQDINKLYDDFFNGYYGAAAPFVRQYFDELQALAKPDKSIVTIVTDVKSPMFPNGFFKRSRQLFNKAEKAVANDPQRLYNVRMSSIPVYYALIRRWPEFKVQWEWLDDGTVKAVGVPPEYAELAREILARMQEGKVTHTSESSLASAKFIGRMHNMSDGGRSLVIKSGAATAGVAAGMGGRLSMWRQGGCSNLLNPRLGGVSFNFNPLKWDSLDHEAFVVKQKNTSEVNLKYRRNWHYEIERSISISPDSLTFNTVVSSINIRVERFTPSITIAPVLGGISSLFIQNGQGKWRKIGIPQNRTFINTIIPGRELVSDKLTIANAGNRRGMRIELPDIKQINRIWINCNTTDNVPRIVIMLKAQKLGAMLSSEEKLNFPLKLISLNNVKGLPAAKKPGRHYAEIIELDDLMLPLVSKAWGNYAADPQAEDGHALRIKNHPTWSMQWNVDPSLFIQGTKYKLQILARVDKTGEPGEVFFAGVYDYNTRKSLGDIKPRASQVKNGYQWYDVAIFTPGTKQRVWAGPGRYDRKGGNKSAVKHLYIDKLRFVRTNETEIVKPGNKRPPADLVILEDCDLPLKPGWCKHVKDAGAGDKRALQLTTYPTWNMQWDVKPAWFNPGKYKVRMRIRVNKSDVPGEAFWAGIYDYKTKRGPQISMKAEDVKDGYQWYEIGSFVPGAKQRVWLGSGRYDRKGGGKSAVKGVYVDRVELKKEEN